MDRYQKVAKKKAETPINENEIRITSQGLVRNYISYATSLLQEKNGTEIVLQGMGQAINKTVNIAEIIKRRIPGLHQDTAISSVKITDEWEPLEEGLCRVEQTRNVSMISITLSTKELNKTCPGYQAPSTVEQSRSQYNNSNNHQQQQPRQALRPYNANYEDSYGRGRSRSGQGQGYSRGRYQNYQENDGYSHQSQGSGRGRDQGYNGNGNGGGRGGGGRGYGGGRGQTGSRLRGGDNQA